MVGLKKTLKSWGFEGVWADTDLYSARSIIIKNGEKTSYVYNKNRDRTIFILQGIVVLTTDGVNRTLKEGDIVRIGPKVMNRFIAIKGDATILEVGTKLEEDVIVEE